MLVPSGQFRIFCSASPLDMLCGMERSAYLVKSELAMNPYSGAVFLFSIAIGPVPRFTYMMALEAAYL